MAEAVVVGGGVGGLAAAIRLGAAGHRVVLFERNDVVGGKLATRRRDGFSFDTGPSLLSLPGVFDELFSVAGTTLAGAVGPVRLDPICRYRFADGSTLDTRSRADDTEAAIEAWSPGSGPAWRRFHDHGASIWGVAERTFLAGPMGSPLALARRLRSPLDLTAIDGVRSLHRRASATFADPRLVQYADRYATYSGSSPYRVPATLACIPFVEQAFGAWYVPGGMGCLAEALAAAAVGVGVTVRTGVDVDRVVRRGGAVAGVRLADGSDVPADVVVANTDARHLFVDLLPDRRAMRRVERAARSSSAFAVLAGVRGRTDGLAHHNVSFSSDYRAEFAALFDQRLPSSDPTVYICCSALTDPGQAPTGDENWFVLVNAPSGGATDWAVEGPSYRDRVLNVLARRGWDLRDRALFTETISPADIAERYRTHEGAIYGTSSNGVAAAFLRPGNRGPVRGLYLVGGSSHPGGGLPLVALSGRIVADLVAADRW